MNTTITLDGGAVLELRRLGIRESRDIQREFGMKKGVDKEALGFDMLEASLKLMLVSVNGETGTGADLFEKVMDLNETYIDLIMKIMPVMGFKVGDLMKSSTTI